jgi:hypothetical protein
MIFEDPLVLRTDRADGLTTLTLNRPAQFNSLSKDMLTAVQAELDDIATSATTAEDSELERPVRRASTAPRFQASKARRVSKTSATDSLLTPLSPRKL